MANEFKVKNGLIVDGTTAINSTMGIGTTPQTMLTISGNSLNNPLMVITSGGTTGLYVSNNGNVGIGTTNPLSKLHVYSTTSGEGAVFENTGSSGITIKSGGSNNTSLVLDRNGNNWKMLVEVVQSDALQFLYNNAEKIRFTNTGLVGIGTTSPSSKLHVVGNGATSTTTSLIITNSTGSNLIRVRDDGFFNIGNINYSTGIRPMAGVDTGTLTPDTPYGLAYRSSYSSQAGWSHSYTSSQSTFRTPTSNNSGLPSANIALHEGFGPSSGNANYAQLYILGGYNTTGTYSGIVRGIYYDPTLTSLTGAIHNAIETTSGDIVFGGLNGSVKLGRYKEIYSEGGIAGRKNYRLYVTPGSDVGQFDLERTGVVTVHLSADYISGGHSYFAPDAGNLGIGLTSGISAKLHVVGGGSTSLTESFRVTNSTLQTLLRITDDGLVRFGNSANTAPYIYTHTTLGTADPNAINFFFNSRNTVETASDGMFTFGGTTLAHTSGNVVLVNMYKSFLPTSGTATYSELRLASTVNQTGGANGITRGLYVIPNLVSAASYRAVELANTSGYGIYQSSSAITNYFNGNVVIGAPSTAYRFEVSGGGTDTVGDFAVDIATSTVYVGRQNATSGNSIFIVRDRLGNNKLYVPGASSLNSYMLGTGLMGFGTSSPTARIHIVGNGNTSATNALLIQNSALSNILTIRNDYALVFGPDGTTPFISAHSANGGDTIVPGPATGALRGLLFRTEYAGPSITGVWVFNRPMSSVSIAGDTINNIVLKGGFSTTSISTNGNSLMLIPTIDMSGGTNIIRGIYYNPILTNTIGTTHYAFESTNGGIRAVSTNSGSPTNPYIFIRYGASTNASQPIFSISNYDTQGDITNLILASNAAASTTNRASLGFTADQGAGNYLVGKISSGYEATNISTISFQTTTTGLGTAYTARFRGRDFIIGDSGTTTPSARMHIVGSGTTSSTRNFTITNSATNHILSIRDDSAIVLGLSGTHLIYESHPVDDNLPSSSQGRNLIFEGVSAGNNSSNGLFQFYANNNTFTSGTNTFLGVRPIFNPTSGTADYTIIKLNPTINQTGGANGIVRGIWLTPTLTSVADYRAIETSNNSGYAIYTSGTAPSYFGGSLNVQTNVNILGSVLKYSSANLYLESTLANAYSGLVVRPNNNTVDLSIVTLYRKNDISNSGYAQFSARGGTEYPTIDLGKLGTGSTPIFSIRADSYFYLYGNPTTNYLGINNISPSATLDIKGSGTTNATRGLLVQNSAGTIGLSVYDNAEVAVGGTITTNTSNQNLYLKPNGSGNLYFGDAGKGMSLFHYSNQTLGTYASYAWSATSNNYNISTPANLILTPAATFNVGIGVASPTATLHIQNTTSGIDVFKITNFVGSYALNNYTFTTPSSFLLKSQGYLLLSSNANPIYISNNNGSTNLITITSSSMIGIGSVISSPSARLELAGLGSTSATYTAKFHNSTGTSNSLVIRDDGNVGIGTSTPIANLDVIGVARISSTLYTSAVKANYIDINTGTSLVFNGTTSTQIMRLSSIDNSVVIGSITTPSARLHLVGSGTTSATKALLVQNSGSALHLLTIQDDGLLSARLGLFQGSYTATTNDYYGFSIEHSLTARATISDVLKGLNIMPTMIAGANDQELVGAYLRPTFTNGAYTNVKNIALDIRAGDFRMSSVDSSIRLKTGLNQGITGTAQLSSGSVTITTPKISTNSSVFVSIQQLATNPADQGVIGEDISGRNVGSDFTIRSTNSSDDSIITWLIIESE
jgi:hypothetical protein